jgi:hypothetical protein
MLILSPRGRRIRFSEPIRRIAIEICARVRNAPVHRHVGHSIYCVFLRSFTARFAWAVRLASPDAQPLLDIDRNTVLSRSDSPWIVLWRASRPPSSSSFDGLGMDTSIVHAVASSRYKFYADPRVDIRVGTTWCRAISMVALLRLGLSPIKSLFGPIGNHNAVLRRRSVLHRRRISAEIFIGRHNGALNMRYFFLLTPEGSWERFRIKNSNV